MKQIDKFFTYLLFIELLLTLSLFTQAKSEVKARSTFFAEQMILTENFNPPKRAKPKDTYGAGSRGRFKYYQEDSSMGNGQLDEVTKNKNFPFLLFRCPIHFLPYG
ncbi:hypothetical protein OGM63_23765 [Plectonema radiosum NIES-515]|uniref:Uncharacterized protein n=1 Tax=Plectonema radiosum NIES-515 TaxID=2986073 RepID=A0ABT3B529_9CYAN|nr:hypothetical protein [Plectonema radiosum]MCV3216493.1 hypothetical protein [Plectonema radiosum NIES-515]